MSEGLAGLVGKVGFTLCTIPSGEQVKEAVSVEGEVYDAFNKTSQDIAEKTRVYVIGVEHGYLVIDVAMGLISYGYDLISDVNYAYKDFCVEGTQKPDIILLNNKGDPSASGQSQVDTNTYSTSSQSWVLLDTVTVQASATRKMNLIDVKVDAYVSGTAAGYIKADLYINGVYDSTPINTTTTSTTAVTLSSAILNKAIPQGGNVTVKYYAYVTVGYTVYLKNFKVDYDLIGATLTYKVNSIFVVGGLEYNEIAETTLAAGNVVKQSLSVTCRILRIYYKTDLTSIPLRLECSKQQLLF